MECQVGGSVLDPDNADDEGWADRAYRCEAIERALEIEGYERQFHEQADRNRPLSEAPKAANREQSQTSAKVEPVLGD